MYYIKPNYPGVIDALSGQPMPLDGITREVLLPPDHVAERSGDVVITPAQPAAAEPAVEAKPGKAKTTA